MLQLHQQSFKNNISVGFQWPQKLYVMLKGENARYEIIAEVELQLYRKYKWRKTEK